MDEKTGNASPEERLAAIQEAEQRLIKRKQTYVTMMALLCCVLILLFVAVMMIYTRCGR